MKISDSLNVGQILTKLTEATTDALFNLPALLTTQSWSKKAPAYLYSFEYAGQSKLRGSSFLNGLPIVSSPKTDPNKIGHGDDLPYLFDARDIFGKQFENTTVNKAKNRIYIFFFLQR